MKFLWQEEEFDERVNGAPKTKCLLDQVTDIAVVLSILYFGAQFLRWWLR